MSRKEAMARIRITFVALAALITPRGRAGLAVPPRHHGGALRGRRRVRRARAHRGSAMSAIFGQTVIVENTTGAGGIVGVTRVISAKPDGYTFLLGAVGTHAYNQTIYKKRRYDAINRR